MNSCQSARPAHTSPVIQLLDYQREDIESAARFRWCCWSRQVGKSFTKSLRRLLRGLAHRRNQIFLSAGERQSHELMLKARQHCRALNIATRFCGSDTFEDTSFKQLTIELPGGIRIIGLPANPQTARGFTGDVLLDEFAMHRDDRDIWAAVFPSVLRGDGELDVASTPKGRDNMFAQLRDNPRFEHSIVTLAMAVAAGLQVDPEDIRRSMHDDELYRQEFECEFLDEATAFLTYDQITNVEDPSLVREFDPNALADCRGELYCGVDIGRVRDLTVMWVVECVDGVLVTRGIRESINEPFRSQHEALSLLLSIRQVRRCCIDAGGVGMAMAEAAAEAFGTSRAEAVTFTAAVKDQLAHGLRRRIEDGTIRIPVDPVIRTDWHSVRRTLSPAGPARYDSSRSEGSHADRFWAACLAVRAAERATPSLSGQIGVIQQGHLRYARDGIW